MANEELRNQDEEDTSQDSGTRSIPLIPYVPDDMQILYADGAYVTLSEGTFIISFVQTEHPLAVTKKQKERIQEIRSKCIARVALNPSRMEAVISILHDTFAQFVEQIEAQKKALGLEDLKQPAQIKSGNEVE